MVIPEAEVIPDPDSSMSESSALFSEPSLSSLSLVASVAESVAVSSSVEFSPPFPR